MKEKYIVKNEKDDDKTKNKPNVKFKSPLDKIK